MSHAFELSLQLQPQRLARHFRVITSGIFRVRGQEEGAVDSRGYRRGSGLQSRVIGLRTEYRSESTDRKLTNALFNTTCHFQVKFARVMSQQELRVMSNLFGQGLISRNFQQKLSCLKDGTCALMRHGHGSYLWAGVIEKLQLIAGFRCGVYEVV